MTTWGNFDPVEITGFLLVAHRITGKQEYLTTLEPLLEKSGMFAIGFPRSIANGQIAVPDSYNFSDDELDFLVYWNLLSSGQGLGRCQGCSQRHCSFVERDFEGARGDLEHDGAGGAGQDGLDGC